MEGRRQDALRRQDVDRGLHANDPRAAPHAPVPVVNKKSPESVQGWSTYLLVLQPFQAGGF